MKKINLLLCFTLGIIIGYIAHFLVSDSSISQRDSKQVVQSNEMAIDGNQPENLKEYSKIKITDSRLSKTTNTTSQQNKFSKLSSQIELLNTQYQNLQEKYKKTNNRLKRVTLEMESLDESDITDEQMMALVKDDFSEFRRSYRGAQRDKIFDFHQQEVDLDWGYDMQTKMSDFILTHYSANGVSLSAINCKKIDCELLIEETEKGAWGKIFDDLTKQEWWKFSTTNSSSRSGENERQLIYFFMSK